MNIIRDVSNSGKTSSFNESLVLNVSVHIYVAANIFRLPVKPNAHPEGVYTEHELYRIIAVSFSALSRFGC